MQYLWRRVVEWGRTKQGDDEEHEQVCDEEGFQMARVKFGRDGEGGRKALDMWNCNINI